MFVAPEILIKPGYIPGTIGRIAELHGIYYYRHWDFGLYFEAKVATELSAFLRRYDAKRDGIWLAVKNGRIEGSIVMDGIDAADKGVHLRWFIVSQALRGRGMGRMLMDCAMGFFNARGFKRAYLWTFEGLDAARRLYESAGFKLTKQQKGEQWGTLVNEQCFELETS